MQSFMPIIVVIYLVVSVIGAVLQSLKKQQPRSAPRIPKVQPAPERPKAGMPQEARHPAGTRLEQPQAAGTMQRTLTAPRVKPSPLSKPAPPQGTDLDYGFDSFAEWEDDADLDLNAAFEELGSPAPGAGPRMPTAPKAAGLDVASHSLASKLWELVVFSEILREPRSRRPWPIR